MAGIEIESQAGTKAVARGMARPGIVAIAVIITIAALFALATLLPETAGTGRAYATNGNGGGGGTLGGGNSKPKKKIKKAKILGNGKASIPTDAPKRVKRAIRAANAIVGKPYGAPDWKKNGKSSRYDCSAAVSYALGKRGAKVLKAPTWSGPLMRWGKKGKGKWLTVYSNNNHAYVMIAGLRFESRGSGDGPKWRTMKATSKDWSGRKYAIRRKSGL